MTQQPQFTDEDLAEWGIAPGFALINGNWAPTPPQTADRIMVSMRANDEWRAQRDFQAPLVIEAASMPEIDGEWIVRCESGDQISGAQTLPDDLPVGYHRLYLADQRERTLIVHPPTCPSFDQLHEWGWAVQLYAMRSHKSWGIGDFGDLREFAHYAKSQGAGFALLNPLHAPLPGTPQESSPYFPSSREFRNPLYIRIEDVPGANECIDDLASLVARGRALNEGERIDRDAVWNAKFEALELLWRQTSPPPAFALYRDQNGIALSRYATFCAICEVHGRIWHHWPSALKDPASQEVERFAKANADRVAFHAWCQWLLDEQLNAVADHLSLIQDLAIGVDPAGADAWLWQDVLALDMRVGAPPDYCNLAGQEWGAPPFDPWRLRAIGYEPFIRTLRAGIRRNGGIRIDHVMGLFRLFWIPSGELPKDGAYVQYPWQDLLGIVALEAQREGAWVIGEDLGTVEPHMRERLAERNVATYKLAWFEPESPATFPTAAFAAATTHDLPTIAGIWTGDDVRLQIEIGLTPDATFNEAIKAKMSERANVPETASKEDFVDAVHAQLAESNSALVAATLEDSLGVTLRPNYPGTVAQYPNWSVPLPIALDDFADCPGMRNTAAIFQRGRSVADSVIDVSQ